MGYRIDMGKSNISWQLIGCRGELVGYSWRLHFSTNKWDVMQVFGDGQAEPVGLESFDTENEARKVAEELAAQSRVSAFRPEHPWTVLLLRK
ncbi:MAG: hypothetical protein JRJ66_02355 [Deltaproteobacteria bacterium]|nr:hypothetical protein [Deltaproteobacteria bacterium]MBW1919215.1 hypothetical protein [Deltaproteobacteria bacterium]MBW1934886.1 hypothetical protein [Deltaproteobacteria bacterium]RLB32518.1 MAG: hypothetical protein DRH11_11435 [Deltaproteobacteria bacterium]